MSTTFLSLDQQTVRLDAGELVSYTVDGHEYIHQKGSPGWRSADTEMFPIIGPTAEANFQVTTPRGAATQDQHGLLREMGYVLRDTSDTTALYEKIYVADTPVRNAKYPAKSTAELLSWPYDFHFRKTFSLAPEGLTIGFEIASEADMPFMLGYHPAFRLTTAQPVVQTDSRRITLAEVMAVGDRALHLPHTQSVLLVDERNLHISTIGFDSFMLWAPVRNMICIEPITFYPYDVEQHQLHAGFQQLSGGQSRWFTMRLTPQPK